MPGIYQIPLRVLNPVYNMPFNQNCLSSTTKLVQSFCIELKLFFSYIKCLLFQVYVRLVHSCPLKTATKRFLKTHKQIKNSVSPPCIRLLEDHWKEKEKKKEFQASVLVYS